MNINIPHGKLAYMYLWRFILLFIVVYSLLMTVFGYAFDLSKPEGPSLLAFYSQLVLLLGALYGASILAVKLMARRGLTYEFQPVMADSPAKIDK